MKTSKILLAAFFVLGLSSTTFAQTTPGGTPTMPNGTTTTPNGTMSNPNGTMTSPDGTMTTPRSTEGTTYDRDRQDRSNMKSKSNMSKDRGKMKNKPMN